MLNKDKLHHAYCFEGDQANSKIKVLDFVEKSLKFKTKGSPDFLERDFNVLKIDDVRAISAQHLNRPIENDKKIFIVSASFITKDAQNTLLKIFEEPSGNTIFFLIIPSAKHLLPTLLSRIIIISNDAVGVTEKEFSAKKFLAAGIGQRLEMTAGIVQGIKDEKLTKADALIFLQDIEKIIKLGKRKNLAGVEDLEQAISYMNDESPSVKIILDHLAITL